MCGIAGVVGMHGRHGHARHYLSRMLDSIEHRGPDDFGIYEDEQALMGMRRLSIIDLDGGHQPIANEDRTVWVVNNGEIYNYQSLRKDLIQRGHRFSTDSDTEVIVHAYEEYGDDFVDHLEGMFGTAIWDTVNSRLVLVRDPMGQKPLYYRLDNKCISFASEVKALAQLPGFSVHVDSAALTDYCSLGYSIAPNTIFRGVRKLPPASMLTLQEGRTQLRQYWSPGHSVDAERSYESWVDRVRHELQRAVNDHTISDVPVGAFLSGGIDSSAIVCLMANGQEHPVSTYSIGYQGGQVAKYYNELPFARTVATAVSSRHREIEVKPNVASLLPRLIWHLEEPISDSAIITTYLVSQHAAEHVKVILSGVGGDELFAGYNRYLGAHFDSWYRLLPSWCRRSVLPSIARFLPSGRQNRLMDLSRYAKRFIEAGQLSWRERYELYVAIASKSIVGRLLGVKDADVDGFSKLDTAEGIDDELLRLFRIDWQSQLAENLLLLTDKMSMAVSLECRVPFLDKRLIELTAQIPAEHKLPKGRLKGLLKHALSDLLPAEIIGRRKRGFGAPVGAWFKDELLPLRKELLSRRTVAHRDMFDPDVVEQICSDHDRGREDYTDLILVLINMEVWSRVFVDGTDHNEVSEQLCSMIEAV